MEQFLALCQPPQLSQLRHSHGQPVHIYVLSLSDLPVKHEPQMDEKYRHFDQQFDIHFLVELFEEEGSEAA